MRKGLKEKKIRKKNKTKQLQRITTEGRAKMK